jgi:hypothetical protein
MLMFHYETAKKIEFIFRAPKSWLHVMVVTYILGRSVKLVLVC